MGQVGMDALFGESQAPASSGDSKAEAAPEQSTQAAESAEVAEPASEAAPEQAAEQAAAETAAPEQAQAAPPAQAEPTIPLSALKDIIAQSVAEALKAAKPPEQVKAPEPAAPPLEVQALQQFERGTIEQRAAVMRQVLGDALVVTRAADGSIQLDRNQAAYVHSHLMGLADRATLRAELDSMKQARAQESARNQQAAYQYAVDQAFHAELAKFNPVTPEVSNVLADLMVIEQNNGKDPVAAAKAAFERGRHLGLRLKGSPGRPTTQQVAASGRAQAQAVTSSGAQSKTTPAETTNTGMKTMRAIIKDAFDF